MLFLFVVLNHDVFALTFLEEIEASTSGCHRPSTRLMASFAALMNKSTVDGAFLRITAVAHDIGGRSLVRSFGDCGQTGGLRFNYFLAVRKCGTLLLQLFRVCPRILLMIGRRCLLLVISTYLSLHIFNLGQELLLIQVCHLLFCSHASIR